MLYHLNHQEMYDCPIIYLPNWDGYWWSPGLFSVFTITMSATIKKFVPILLSVWKYPCKMNSPKGNCTVKGFLIANFDRYCHIAFCRYNTNLYPDQHVLQCFQPLHNTVKIITFPFVGMEDRLYWGYGVRWGGSSYWCRMLRCFQLLYYSNAIINMLVYASLYMYFSRIIKVNKEQRKQLCKGSRVEESLEW